MAGFFFMVLLRKRPIWRSVNVDRFLDAPEETIGATATEKHERQDGQELLAIGRSAGPVEHGVELVGEFRLARPRLRKRRAACRYDYNHR
jgi:hypothetical protein